jgi:hypothetical protein
MRAFAMVGLAVALSSCAQAPPPDQPFAPTAAERLKVAGDAMQGMPTPNIEEQARAKNLTYQYLVRNGIDQETAKAPVLNPAIMQVVMAQIARRQLAAQ